MGFTAASELAWYAEQGIPGVIFGPGSIAQAHSPDEFVELDSATRRRPGDGIDRGRVVRARRQSITDKQTSRSAGQSL